MAHLVTDDPAGLIRNIDQGFFAFVGIGSGPVHVDQDTGLFHDLCDDRSASV
jgi:hypothetical protein